MAVIFLKLSFGSNPSVNGLLLTSSVIVCNLKLICKLVFRELLGSNAVTIEYAGRMGKQY